MKEKQSFIPPVASALVLSSDRAGAARDAGSLEALRVENVVVMSSGAWAAKYLSRHPVDIIVCDTKLSDMTGQAFLKSLRTYPGLESIPAVMVTRDGSRKSVLAARDAGVSGYVLRPYDMRTFAEKVVRVAGLRPVDDAVEVQSAETFDAGTDREKEAWSWYARGLRYLTKGLYDSALEAFKAAIRLKDMFAEAYEGLARAWRGKGSLRRYSVFMKKAAVLFARNRKASEARKIFEQLLRVNPEAGNPFSSVGMRMMQKGEYKPAAQAYDQALVLASSSRDVYADIARACHFTKDPVFSARRLCSELGAMRSFPDAQTLFGRVMGPPVEKQPTEKADRTSFIKLPEKMRIFLAVAGHTLEVYRKGLAAGEV